MSAAQLKKMKKELDEVLSQATFMAFVQVVRRHENANLGDVMALAQEMGIENATVGELFFDDLPRSGKDWAKNKKAIAAKKPKAKDGVPNLRTVKGREEYDVLVFQALEKSGDWTPASFVRERAGGNEHQARASLNRLIESGRVEYRGRSNATRYKAVA
ncbi:MAG: hypothetical protein ACYTBS_11675 [Planctomycetota bacterium]|jgi:hypothetical protein